MPDQPKTPRPAVLISSAFLIAVFSTTGFAQRQPRLRAPPTLLDVLDREDRDCVNQSGLDKSVTVQPIQLARDRTQQILIKGAGLCLCGAQNCGFWIYRKSGSKYELLLKGIGSTKVGLGQQSSNGYRDVVTESHASAIETIVRTYRFDGQQYQLQRCMSRAYFDENGNQTKRPILRPCE